MTKYSNYKTPQIRSCFEPICVAMKPIEKSFLNNEIKYNTGLLDVGPKTRVGYQKRGKAPKSATEGWAKAHIFGKANLPTLSYHPFNK